MTKRLLINKNLHGGMKCFAIAAYVSTILHLSSCLWTVATWPDAAILTKSWAARDLATLRNISSFANSVMTAHAGLSQRVDVLVICSHRLFQDI